jgi:hypothetical protein
MEPAKAYVVKLRAKNGCNPENMLIRLARID